MTDSNFVAMINYALQFGEATPLELGDYLGVSGPTVKRWSDGQNLPYDALRLPVRDAVKTFLEDRS